MFFTTAAVTASVITLAWGHAVMLTPPPRTIGDAQTASCGAAVTKRLNSDKAGPLENSVAVIDADYNCNLFLCRGYQFEDNIGRVISVSQGDVVDFHIDIIAGHRPGYANISVVDTNTNQMLGEPLKIWSNFLGNEPDSARDEADFNVTIPGDLPDNCAVAGNCVLQWYWYATQNKQTYISCVDFELSD